MITEFGLVCLNMLCMSVWFDQSQNRARIECTVENQCDISSMSVIFLVLKRVARTQADERKRRREEAEL